MNTQYAGDNPSGPRPPNTFLYDPRGASQEHSLSPPARTSTGATRKPLDPRRPNPKPQATPPTPTRGKKCRTWGDEVDDADRDISDLDDVFMETQTTPTGCQTTQATPTPAPEIQRLDLMQSMQIEASRANLQTHVMLATVAAKNLISLMGKLITEDDHIRTITANLLQTITGRQNTENPDPTNQETTMLNAIKSLTGEVQRIVMQVSQLMANTATTTPNDQAPGLEESMHNLNNARPRSYAQAAAGNSTQQQPQALAQPKPTTNPSKAHHPSWLVVTFDNPVSKDSRWDEAAIIQDINAHLAAKGIPAHLKITAVKWNLQGNCIVFMQADQQAAKVIPYTNDLPGIIAPGHSGRVREDKKWYKVEVTNVKIGAFDQGVFSPDIIHDHLREMNPDYASLNMVMLPQWVRPPSEISMQPYSSVVFAVDSFKQHANLLRNTKTFAAFGRLAHIREWANWPPIIQCRRCWQSDHCTPKCRNNPRFRLCSKEHMEEQHHTLNHQDPNDTAMDTDANTRTTMTCINCKTAGIQATDHPAGWTHCPEHLCRVGNPRERTQMQKRTVTTQRATTSNNRYSALANHGELLAEIATDTSWVEDLMDSSDDATFFDSYNIEIPEFLVPA